jgi:hypothetical protein
VTSRPASLDGQFTVEDAARILRHYRYATERMTRVLGGWLALTPELSAKLLMGRHVWDNAQHADAFGKRLPELRAHAQTSEPANLAFAAFMDALESPDAPQQTVERLVGVYRVLKPHLVATYERHLALANGVYEPPTRRILSRCLEDERRHIVAGETVLRHLTGSAALTERAAAWRFTLITRLGAAEGVTGDLLSAPDGEPAMVEAEGESAEAEEFIRLEAAATRWPMPDELATAVRAFGSALVARDAAEVDRWLARGLAGSAEVQAAISRARFAESRIVACARIGAQRVVKLRLDGSGTAVVLFTRWAPGADGWRVEAIEPIAATSA